MDPKQITVRDLLYLIGDKEAALYVAQLEIEQLRAEAAGLRARLGTVAVSEASLTQLEATAQADTTADRRTREDQRAHGRLLDKQTAA